METIREFTAVIVITLGTLFSLAGMVGYIRLPDVYTRLHATGKVGNFGVVLLLVAAILLTPLGWGRGLLLIILLMVGGPVVSHAIASAAYQIAIPMTGERDDLSKKRKSSSE